MTPADGQQQATVGLALSAVQAEPSLTALFDDYDLVDCDDTVPAAVDLCLVDAATLRTQPALVTDWRAQQSPVFAPVVLLADASSQSDQGVDTESPVRYDSVIEPSTPTAARTRRIDNLLQRRALSQELADTKQLTASIFESSPLAKLIVGADGTIERANARAGELFATPHTELVGGSYSADGWITLDDGTKRIVENGFPVADVTDTAEPISEHDCTITRPHDDDVMVSVNAVPIHTDDAAVGRVLLTLTDITARREHANERDRQVDLFTKAQDIANVGAWEYDLHTDDFYWTDEVYQIYGLSTDAEVTSERGIAAYHPADRPEIQDAFQQAVDEGKSYDLELRLINDTDTLRWVRTRGEPQFDDDGDVVRVRGTRMSPSEKNAKRCSKKPNNSLSWSFRRPIPVCGRFSRRRTPSPRSSSRMDSGSRQKPTILTPSCNKFIRRIGTLSRNTSARRSTPTRALMSSSGLIPMSTSGGCAHTVLLSPTPTAPTKLSGLQRRSPSASTE